MSYMAWSWISLAACMVVIVLEMLLPSDGILFVLSVLLAITAIVCGFLHSFSLGALMITILVLSMPALFALFSYLWPKTPLGRKIIMSAPDLDAVLPVEDGPKLADLVGQIGVVASPMLPTGSMTLAGKTWVATTESGAVDIGVPVRVTKIRMNRIYVLPESSTIPAEPADPTPSPGKSPGSDAPLATAEYLPDFEWDESPPLPGETRDEYGW